MNSTRKLLFLLGGVLIMTTISGCSTKPSKQEIISKFDDFITIFPSEDLSFLYDKEGDTTDLDEGDLGTWVVSSYIDTTMDERSKTFGVVLWFNRNTRESLGHLYIVEYDNGEGIEKKYPVKYNKGNISFTDTNVEESLVNELNDFKMLSEILKINDEYLRTLTTTKHFYNSEVPLYGVTFKLNDKDVNIKMIMETYPNLPIDKDNLELDFEGSGSPWSTTSDLNLHLFLDEESVNYFTASLNFVRSDRFKQQQDEE